MTLQFETLRVEQNDGIAIVTLNRPERLNALTRTMIRELVALFDHTDANDAVKAIIVTGAGRAYCAGMDLEGGAATFDHDLANDPDVVNGVRRDGGGKITLRIFNSLKPIIAAVNGAAVGIGATMQLPMDIRIASTTAKFGFVFARRGIVPEAASSWFLPRVVGISTALEWCYSGRLIPAEEARQRGLVRSLHAPEELLPAAVAMARDIIDNTAPVSVALTRQLFWRMLTEAHPMTAHTLDSRGLQFRGKSEDAKEGVTAFLEKRPARFRNQVSTDMPPFVPWWSDPPFK
jgi:enoyl-CoA hydratase/carnithine racemase